MYSIHFAPKKIPGKKIKNKNNTIIKNQLKNLNNFSNNISSNSDPYSENSIDISKF